jgi:hypothetical protein
MVDFKLPSEWLRGETENIQNSKPQGTLSPKGSDCEIFLSSKDWFLDDVICSDLRCQFRRFLTSLGLKRSVYLRIDLLPYYIN